MKLALIFSPPRQYDPDGRLLYITPAQVELWHRLATEQGCTISEMLDRAVARIDATDTQ